MLWLSAFGGAYGAAVIPADRYPGRGWCLRLMVQRTIAAWTRREFGFNPIWDRSMRDIAVGSAKRS